MMGGMIAQTPLPQQAARSIAPWNVHMEYAAVAEAPLRDLQQGAYTFDCSTADSSVERMPAIHVDDFDFTCKKLVFQYDKRAFIHLRAPLHVEGKNGYLHIKEWDADIPYDSTSPRQMLEIISEAIMKTFQTLFQDAANGTLTPTRRGQWLKVLQTFDYPAFRSGLNHPTSEEGKIWSINRPFAVIEWEGERRDRCPLSFSPSFTNGRLTEGDRFGAMVTRGQNNAIVNIDDIQVLPPEETKVPWEKVEAI